MLYAPFAIEVREAHDVTTATITSATVTRRHRPRRANPKRYKGNYQHHPAAGNPHLSLPPEAGFLAKIKTMRNLREATASRDEL
jgi:hypothetical protein